MGATVEYMNKKTKQKFQGDAEAVESLKAHPVLGSLYSYELAATKPAEVKKTDSKTADKA